MLFFYQKYWKIVGDDVSHIILEILNENRDLTYFNYTYITLVPKLPKSTSHNDFQPISLCNVIIKILTKCIANKLKGALPCLIGETQSIFVSGWLIDDNTLIAC